MTLIDFNKSTNCILQIRQFVAKDLVFVCIRFFQYIIYRVVPKIAVMRERDPFPNLSPDSITTATYEELTQMQIMFESLEYKFLTFRHLVLVFICFCLEGATTFEIFDNSFNNAK